MGPGGGEKRVWHKEVRTPLIFLHAVKVPTALARDGNRITDDLWCVARLGQALRAGPTRRGWEQEGNLCMLLSVRAHVCASMLVSVHGGTRARACMCLVHTLLCMHSSLSHALQMHPTAAQNCLPILLLRPQPPFSRSGLGPGTQWGSSGSSQERSGSPGDEAAVRTGENGWVCLVSVFERGFSLLV